MALIMQRRLVEHLRPGARDRTVSDVRIGLGYTAVRLDSGHAGVAWTPGSEARGCTHFQGAGTLAGQSAWTLLQYLAEAPSSLGRAIGLATANALLAALPHPGASREDVLAVLDPAPGERVAMAGYFRPLVDRLKATGCRLDIIEWQPRPGEAFLNPEQGAAALAGCELAILTGTALINGSLDGVLASLGRPRAAVLLGPSTPICPDIFLDTPITHLAGSRVLDPEAVLRVVSEGGGTQVLKPYLAFETVSVGASQAGTAG